MADYKEAILAELETLKKAETVRKNVFKARAYGKVIAQIRARDGPVRAFEDLAGVEGIGKSIEEKIKEIILTGHLQAAAVIREDAGLTAVETLMKIHGIGPVKARDLAEKQGIRDYAALRAAVAANPRLLNEKQKIGLRYVEDFLARIPRTEMDEHANLLRCAIRGVDRRFEVEIVGSYRRGAADSGDIDVLMRLPAHTPEAEIQKLFHAVCTALRESGYVTDVLAEGDKKFMGVCRAPRRHHHRRLDLLITPWAEYPYALLYFTGSDKFNIGMRRHALARGYTLNEHAMKPVREDTPLVPNMESEEDIFAFLEYPYISPLERNKKL
jgi:DNA polymerase/3'-5' exonuclease PolX